LRGHGTEPRPPLRLRRIVVAAESVGYSADPPLAVTVCPLALRYATQAPEWGVWSVHIAFLPAPLSGSRERERGSLAGDTALPIVVARVAGLDPVGAVG
jgi:hypothetical protein